jgi:putative protease
MKYMAEEEQTEGEEIGKVSNYFDHVKVAAIKLEGELSVGDTLRFVGGETDFEQTIDSMQIQREAVESAKAGDEIGIKVKEKVRKGYKVYKL